MPAPPRLALALAACLIVAGCQGPMLPAAETSAQPRTANDTPATTAQAATPSPTPTRIAVRNGSLPVDPNTVFSRLQAVLGTNAAPPVYVEVVADADALGPGPGGGLQRAWRLLGLRAGGLERDQVDRLENGVTTGLGGIRLYLPGNTSPATVEWLLAHEFVHYIAIQRGLDTALVRRLPRTTDASGFVARAVVEGTAVYATDAYIERYGLATAPNSRVYVELRSSITEGSVDQYVNDAYVSGSRYVSGQAASPRRLGAFYRRGPNTSEQVLHGYRPGAEPPVPLAVQTNRTGQWRAVGQDTLGEAFVRSVLDRTLTRGRAAEAAAGWGNDSFVVFRASDRADATYVWVLRWDDRANAAEFHEAVTAHFDARGDRLDRRRWTVAGVQVAVERPGPRTVVITLGASGFIDGVEVTVDGPVVRIETP